MTRIVVDAGSLDDAALAALARARLIRGPAALVQAVRHLAPPVTRVEIGEPVARDTDPSATVLLVASS